MDCNFVVIEVNPCVFMSNTVICVVYLDDCLFWVNSQHDIGNIMSYLNSMDPVTICNTQRESQCLGS